MDKHDIRRGLLCTLICLAAWPAIAPAHDNDDDQPTTNPSSLTAGDARFGAFDLLDHRSAYYHQSFPEPFRVEDTTLDQEFRLDWQHAESRTGISNLAIAEVQQPVGIVTFEVQTSYAANQTTSTSEDDPNPSGFGSIELGARFPVCQFVSTGRMVDNTTGLNLEVGVPTNSPLSKNTEITPGVFDDLLIGQFSVQSLIGISSLLGSKPLEGRESIEYGVAFGYAVAHEEFPLPGIDQTTPIFELVGETALSGPRPGQDALTATAGIRFEFKSIGPIQPELGLAYFFPIDQGGREELKWGTILSLDFDF
jgi:hypothetical protein